MLGNKAALPWTTISLSARYEYSAALKNIYSILEVAKMFKSKIIFLKPRLGERYASALTKISQNNKIIQKYGNLQLKDYISSFIKSLNLWKLKVL